MTELEERELPMFPLNHGLVPLALLPLHIFEPRYLEMFDQLGADGEFGVVLIERGSEVGGEDERFAVGCAARVMQVRCEPGQPRLVVARGTNRIRVVSWLPDDPYPRAMVNDLAEGPLHAPEERMRLEALTNRALALASELGYDVGSGTPLDTDAAIATYQALIQVPVSTIDRQRVLEMGDPTARLEGAAQAIESFAELAEMQLGAAT